MYIVRVQCTWVSKCRMYARLQSDNKVGHLIPFILETDVCQQKSCFTNSLRYCCFSGQRWVRRSTVMDCAESNLVFFWKISFLAKYCKFLFFIILTQIRSGQRWVRPNAAALDCVDSQRTYSILNTHTVTHFIL